MKMTFTILVTLLLCCPFLGKTDTMKPHSTSIPTEEGCDTLFLKDGTIRLVTIIDENKEFVVFQKCDSLENDRYTLPMDKVERFSYNNTAISEKQLYRKDPIGRQARRALVLCIIGTAILGVLSVYGIPGYILIAIGIFKAERVLRKLKKLKDYKFERKARHDSRAAIILGMIMVIAPIALYLLVTLLI